MGGRRAGSSPQREGAAGARRLGAGQGQAEAVGRRTGSNVPRGPASGSTRSPGPTTTCRRSAARRRSRWRSPKAGASATEGFELGNKFPREPAALRAAARRATASPACRAGIRAGSGAAPSTRRSRAVEAHLDAARRQRRQGHGLRRGRRWLRPGRAECRSTSARGSAATTTGAPTASGSPPSAAPCSRAGVRLAYHHHMGAYVETAEDVDRLMASTGPEVGLLLDTGHVTFAGGGRRWSCCEARRPRLPRPLKDVRPAVVRMARNRGWSFLQAVLNGAFTVPGDGSLDFERLLARPATATATAAGWSSRPSRTRRSPPPRLRREGPPPRPGAAPAARARDRGRRA